MLRRYPYHFQICQAKENEIETSKDCETHIENQHRTATCYDYDWPNEHSDSSTDCGFCLDC
jgi:hypothetical protein